jgi:hypothetical protein
MTTMLEKMTRAIWTQLPQDDANMVTSGRIARAALQAIREPDDAMLAPACKKHKPGEPMSEARPEECHIIARRRQTFTAMIDAILSEK